MKNSTFCYSLIFLCAGFCCPGENEYENRIYNFEQEDLIQVLDSETNFNLNDTIWIKTEVPVELELEGQDLNLSEITGNAQAINIPLGFYQLTNFDNPLEVVLSENEIVNKTGETSTTYGIQAKGFLEGNRFIKEFGIILKQPGNFIISSSYQLNANNLYVNSQNYTSVSIKTTFKDGENPQEYRITVE